MIARQLTGGLLTIAGAAGVTACVLSANAGMQDVMQTDGGSCASGGPYVSVNPCSSGDMRLLMVGILGGLVALAVYSAGTSLLGRPASLAGLAAWTALFGALGWNFIDTYLRAPHKPGAGAFVFTGGAFEVMALGGLVMFLLTAVRDLRYSGRPDPALAGMQPLVMAVAPPGFSAPVPPGGGGWTGGTGWTGGVQDGAGGPAGVGGAGGWASGGPGGWAPGRPWTMARPWALSRPWTMGGGPAAAMAADPSARRRELIQVVMWLADSVAGVALGAVLSGSLITLLQ